MLNPPHSGEGPLRSRWWKQYPRNGLSSLLRCNTLCYPLRHAVSGKKRRFQQEGFDLDLTYLTKRVVVCGYPATGLEHSWRNPRAELRRLLDKFHPDAYKVYNFTNEPGRGYPPEVFHGRVERYPFRDHSCPPLSLVVSFCESALAWLTAHPSRVVVLHCKAGKGRAGILACCLLLRMRFRPTADEVLRHYDSVRVTDQRGLTVKAQRKFVYLYERLVQQCWEERALSPQGGEPETPAGPYACGGAEEGEERTGEATAAALHGSRAGGEEGETGGMVDAAQSLDRPCSMQGDAVGSPYACAVGTCPPAPRLRVTALELRPRPDPLRGTGPPPHALPDPGKTKPVFRPLRPLRGSKGGVGVQLTTSVWQQTQRKRVLRGQSVDSYTHAHTHATHGNTSSSGGRGSKRSSVASAPQQQQEQLVMQQEHRVDQGQEEVGGRHGARGDERGSAAFTARLEGGAAVQGTFCVTLAARGGGGGGGVVSGKRGRVELWHHTCFMDGVPTGGGGGGPDTFVSTFELADLDVLPDRPKGGMLLPREGTLLLFFSHEEEHDASLDASAPTDTAAAASSPTAADAVSPTAADAVSPTAADAAAAVAGREVHANGGGAGEVPSNGEDEPAAE